jgi:RimJ/RimL family protein N-acetyltransferase
VRPFPTDIRLQGDGFVLREWTDADIPAMIETIDEPDVARYTRLASPFGEAAAKTHLEKGRANRTAGKAIQLMIELDTGQVGGTMALFRTGQCDDTAELGYTVDKTLRGQGLGARALAVMTTYGYELGFEKLVLRIEDENTASQSVARKAGFRVTDTPPLTDEIKGRMTSHLLWKHER